MIEDKKPEPADEERELTRKCKTQIWLFDMKIVSLIMFVLSAGINSVINDGKLGLWGEWYVLGPLIVLWMVAPMRKPEKEYKK